MKGFPSIRLLLSLLLIIICVLIWSGFHYTKQLSKEIRTKFDGKKWEIPAIVYARPLELYPGMALTPKLLEKEVVLAGYRHENPITAPGGYFHDGNQLYLSTRDFHFPSGLEKSQKLHISFQAGKIQSITAAMSGDHLEFIRLDPARIGSFHPTKHEDRLLLSDSDIPEILKHILITVEDKSFHSHHGISPLAIIRALLVNIRAGKTLQGGSTLTQQLVKNLFLGRQRTLTRKIKEAAMAVVLEYHYAKDEILTAYVNEVFLGQDGTRAIHGFGLASTFYFRRDIKDLSVGQLATLVGMVKGPSIYDPRKHPDGCEARRNTVLQLLLEDGIISESELQNARTERFGDIKVQRNGFNRFPAYLDLVRHQLQTEYKEADLRSNGLKILTNLNPKIQWQIEDSLAETTVQLEGEKGNKQLQGAVIISGRETGEVLGLAGGVDPLKPGFNRALNANRSIGSLMKPVVYLAGLNQGYNLASPLMDVAISVQNGSQKWRPKNYDNQEHGRVPLYRALAKSYNLATVRLGMDVGLETVTQTLNDLGYTKKVSPYPSILLGAVDMSPYQVNQVYQTIASGGFYLPLRSIRSVLTQDNSVLRRYGLEVEQRFSPSTIFLLNHGLQRVITEGTGSRFPLPKKRLFSGKTGTSNDMRDSWFAGYSSSHLGVVWLGRDDNNPIGLTGSSGALQVWGKIMQSLESNGSEPDTEVIPADVTWIPIDQKSLLPTTAWHPQATKLPFIVDNRQPSSPSMVDNRPPSPVERTKTVKQPSRGPAIDLKKLEKKTKQFFDSLNSLFH